MKVFWKSQEEIALSTSKNVLVLHIVASGEWCKNSLDFFPVFTRNRDLCFFRKNTVQMPKPIWKQPILSGKKCKISLVLLPYWMDNFICRVVYYVLKESVEVANPDPWLSGWAGLAGPLAAVLEAWLQWQWLPAPAGDGITEEEREGKAGLDFQASWTMMCTQGDI